MNSGEYRFEFHRETPFNNLRVRMFRTSTNEVRDIYASDPNDVLQDPKKYWGDGQSVVVPMIPKMHTAGGLPLVPMS